jgi:polyprenyl P-hydroxybenzoate/phenylacrylic acid decarboxylase-like protein
MLNAPRRLVIAITGASGAQYGIDLLQTLKPRSDIETHLVVSPSGWLTIGSETDFSKTDVEALADVVHSPKAIGDTIASGSFRTAGMVVAPCSMHTLAAVAHGMSDNLIARAADVTLKERRRLILLTRETPLNLAHLRNMVSVTEMGGIIMPPVPAFYHRPTQITELFAESTRRVLDLLDLADDSQIKEWPGLNA